MRRHSPLLTSLILVIVACSHAPPPQTATVVQQGTRVDPGYSINAAELRRDLFIFADDSFRGRETGTSDARRAAAFLARRAQQLGLEPAGDSLYMQRVPMVRLTLARATQLTVKWANGQRQSLRIGGDVTPVISFGGDVPPVSRNVDGDVLFVGHGPDDERQAMGLMPLSPEGRVLVTVFTSPNVAGDAAARSARDAAMIGRL